MASNSNFLMGVSTLEVAEFKSIVIDAALEKAQLQLVEQPAKGNDQVWHLGCKTPEYKVSVIAYGRTGSVVFQNLSPIKLGLCKRAIKSW